MYTDFTTRLNQEMGTLLLSLRGSSGIDISQGEEKFPLFIDAFRRGWIEAKALNDQDGYMIQLHILGLSELGYRIADAYECALEDRQLKKRLKRLFQAILKWFFGSVERVLLTLLGSDMILRWLVFFFKD